MNCLCNLFDNEVVWLIIIALLILGFNCNNPCCGGGYGSGSSGNYGSCGCTCGCN